MFDVAEKSNGHFQKTVFIYILGDGVIRENNGTTENTTRNGLEENSSWACIALLLTVGCITLDVNATMMEF